MNPEEIRKQTILALFSDDYLFERLVLKGGNAIHLVHKLALRSSLDLDFSMSGDFEDLDEAKRHLFTALKSHFAALGFIVFDELLTPKPKIQSGEGRSWWGGYELLFKIISREKFHQLSDRGDRLRANALTVGPRQERKFSIDLSKGEYTGAKATVAFGEYAIPVYTLEMIAVEKLRAICQQMPEYEVKGTESHRARDFYDIHLILTQRNIDLDSAENQELIKQIFAAKRVPLDLLGKIVNHREFHRADWPAVLDAVSGVAESYDFYFDYVLAVVQRLQPLWVVDTPC